MGPWIAEIQSWRKGASKEDAYVFTEYVGPFSSEDEVNKYEPKETADFQYEIAHWPLVKP